MGRHPVIRLTGDGPLDSFVAAALEVDGVINAAVLDGRADVVATVSATLLSKLLDLAEHTGVRVGGVQVESPDLEDVFLHLTGKALRD